MKDTNKIILNKELLNLKIIKEDSNYSNILNINHILESESIELSNIKITKIDLKHSNKLNINQMLESDYIDLSNIYNIVFSKKKMGLFKNLCQAGKITNTKGHTDEYRDRC